MIDDLINLTQMQFFIKYWWLYAAIFGISVVFIYLYKGESEMLEKRKVEKSEEYKPIRARGYLGIKKGNLYLKPKDDNEEVQVTFSDTQLDRIEKKMDRILTCLDRDNRFVLREYISSEITSGTLHENVFIIWKKNIFGWEQKVVGIYNNYEKALNHRDQLEKEDEKGSQYYYQVEIKKFNKKCTGKAE